MKWMKAIKIGLMLIEKIERYARDGKITREEMLRIMADICNILEVTIE
jgi:hypothetical protein